MIPRPPVVRRGVEWFVLRSWQVPVRYPDGRPIPASWGNKKTLATTRKTKVIGRVWAPTIEDAQALAEAYYGLGLSVQSAASAAAGMDDRSIIRRDRIPITPEEAAGRKKPPGRPPFPVLLERL
jgi:hypothetical protein